MRWVETKITFHSDDEPLAVELIADIFYQFGAKGVVVDDPSAQPHEEWAPDALPPPTEPAITAYLPEDDGLEQRRLNLEQAMAELAGAHRIKYAMAYTVIDEEDWAESWKEFFEPQEITPRLVVKPSWRDYLPKPGQHVIEIDPGMAFGTGTHPTTALCIQLMEAHVRPGQAVLDVGTGSGILLIAAAKLGAGRLAGVDHDPNAVAIAGENLARNRIAANACELHSGHLIEPVTGSYDLVVANILAEIILELLDHVERVIKPGGILICSGIIQAYQNQVARKLARCGFDDLQILHSGDWVAFCGRLGG